MLFGCRRDNRGENTHSQLVSLKLLPNIREQQNLPHLLNPLMAKTAQTCSVERRDIWTSLPVTHTSLAYRLPSSSGCESTGSVGMQQKQLPLVTFPLAWERHSSFHIWLKCTTTCFSLIPQLKKSTQMQQVMKKNVEAALPGLVNLLASGFLPK